MKEACRAWPSCCGVWCMGCSDGSGAWVPAESAGRLGSGVFYVIVVTVTSI